MALIADLESKLEDQEHLTEQQRLMLQRQLNEAKTRKATKVFCTFCLHCLVLSVLFMQIHLSFMVYVCVYICVPFASTPRKYAASGQRDCVRGGGQRDEHARLGG